jgi:hypothetical protein
VGLVCSTNAEELHFNEEAVETRTPRKRVQAPSIWRSNFCSMRFFGWLSILLFFRHFKVKLIKSD